MPRQPLTTSQRSQLPKDRGLDLTPPDPITNLEGDELWPEELVNADPGAGRIWVALWDDGGVPLTPD